MNSSVTLPRLIGTRDAATRILEEQDVSRDLTGKDVEIIARNLSTSTISFTDELLMLLEERHPREIFLVGAPREFRDQVEKSSSTHGFLNIRSREK